MGEFVYVDDIVGGVASGLRFKCKTHVITPRISTTKLMEVVYEWSRGMVIFI